MLILFFGSWWTGLDGIQQIFWGIAIVFSILFVIQFALSLIGLDFDTDVDTDTGQIVAQSLGTDISIFTIRGIFAFFSFFGWTGGLVLNNGGSPVKAVVYAGVSGTLAMALLGYVMYLFHKLGEVGNVDITKALDHQGEVFLPIPERQNGQGKIHVSLQGALKELDAVTKGSAIPTGTPVKIVKVLQDNILLVEPLEV